MRKLILLIGVFCLAMETYSQSDVNNTEPVTETKSSHGTKEAGESVKLDSGIGFDYMAIENTSGGFGINLIFDGFLLNFKTVKGDTDSYVTKNKSWGVGIGGNRRCWLSKYFFVEGQFGVEYVHSSLKYKVDKNKTTKDSNGDLGLFVTPRIGIKLGKGLGIVAGYRCDFAKFKFNKENTSDYFTVGISWIWE